MVMLTAIRIWLPVAICVAGVVLVIARGGDLTSLEGAAALWGAGLSVALINWLFRYGAAGDRARDAEDEARRFFAEHGYWPDEEPKHR
jgi:drug/metabolite transporter (DMT)-like permease